MDNSYSNLYIVIPCYGSKEPLSDTLNKIPFDELKNKSCTTNVLIIATPDFNDSVPDLSKLKQIHPNIEMIIEKERGYGRAYKTGFEYLKTKEFEYIITGDADGTYALEDIPSILEQMNGSTNLFMNAGRLKKYKQGAFSRRNLVGNHLLTWGTRVLFLTKMNDSQSGMWIFQKQVLDIINLDKLGNGMEFSAQIKVYAIRNKLIKYDELETNYYPRIGSTPQLRWLKDAVRVAWKTFLFRFKKIN